MAAKQGAEKVISPIVFRRMLLSGGKMLEVNRNQIDSLNVFPVPDGDTGTNMSLTMISAVKEICSTTTNTMDVICDLLSRGALRGARGNSGVILSQIFKGIANSLSVCSTDVSAKDFAKALKAGVELAYSAVAKPKEGTMLTVIRVIAEKALELAKRPIKMDDFLTELVTAGEDILAKTPEMLEVLKRAGVVDSGGYGIVCLFKGFVLGYKGEEVSGAEDYNPAASSSSQQSSSIGGENYIDYNALDDIEFAYCTEFFVINLLKKTMLSDIDKLREKLNEIGDSTLVIGDLSLVKVHVHTNKPSLALGYALELGEVDKIKIENMLEQNRELKKRYDAERKAIGMLAVCAGDGFGAIFKDLMVDQVIAGGQTMNPSADDIAQAVNKINAENVIVFPNNKNIILAAEQARALVTTKQVFVVPTNNMPQGLAATLAFDPEASISDNLVNMNYTLSAVHAGSVTFAVRNSVIDDISLKQGDIIGLDEHKILTKGNNPETVTINLIKAMKTDDMEIISLYYGHDVKEETADKFLLQLREMFPDCEIDIHYGGQPLYYYIFSLE